MAEEHNTQMHSTKHRNIQYKLVISFEAMSVFWKCVGGDGERYFGGKRILEMENMEI